MAHVTIFPRVELIVRQDASIVACPYLPGIWFCLSMKTDVPTLPFGLEQVSNYWEISICLEESQGQTKQVGEALCSPWNTVVLGITHLNKGKFLPAVTSGGES